MTIVFNTNGTASCLYSEDINLSEIGVLAIQRLSLIEFDADRQVWTVNDRHGEEAFNNPSRQVCLDWEASELEAV